MVPYEWTDRGVAPGADRPGARAGPARARRRRGRRRGGPARASRAPCLGPRHLGLLAPRPASRPCRASAAAGRGGLDRLRAARARPGAGPRLDLRRQLLPARRPRRRRGRRDRLPGRDRRPTNPAAFLDALRRPAGPAPTVVVTSGGVSQGDFDVVKEALAPLGTVWFGPVAMQPGKPQGFGARRRGRDPDLPLPGNPVSSYISFEAVRAPGPAQDDGQGPVAPGPRRRRADRRRRLARGVGGSSCAAGHPRRDGRGSAWRSPRWAARAPTWSATSRPPTR